MSSFRSLVLIGCCLAWLSPALAQTSTPKAAPGKAAPAKSGTDKAGKATATPPAKSDEPTERNDPAIDLIYGAYQRGMYKEAYNLALARAQDANDPKAMAMLGELHSNALGIKRDYAEAAKWYRKAADLGDREAMFALGMLHMSDHNGQGDREQGIKWLTKAAELGNPKAAYNLALLHMDGQSMPRDFTRAAELLRQSADAGVADAQYALANFYKEGMGVEKDITKSTRLLQSAAVADNLDAIVEYAIALYNGSGTPKNEIAAVNLLRKAARRNSPIAQNRLARLLVTGGKGASLDLVEGLKWHLVAKSAGKGDLMLDERLATASPEDRTKAEDAARKWLGAK